MQPLRILETSLYAADLAAAELFYTTVLGLTVIGRAAGRHVFFRCGDGVLLVFDPARTRADPSRVDGQSIPLHGAEGAGHVAFAVSEAELDEWRTRLKGNGVTIESEVTWPGAGRSLYFRDPAGNSLELATPEIWG